MPFKYLTVDNNSGHYGFFSLICPNTGTSSLMLFKNSFGKKMYIILCPQAVSPERTVRQEWSWISSPIALRWWCAKLCNVESKSVLKERYRRAFVSPQCLHRNMIRIQTHSKREYRGMKQCRQGRVLGNSIYEIKMFYQDEIRPGVCTS